MGTITRYFKVNPKVVEFLGLTDSRIKLPDGNYVLWSYDLGLLGPLPDWEETLTRIGGIGLTSIQARQEQRGEVSLPLPEPTDPRFIPNA